MRITLANQLSELPSNHFLDVQVLVGKSRRALGVCGLRLTADHSTWPSSSVAREGFCEAWAGRAI